MRPWPVARVILEVDGKSEVYKTGDALPDGEKLAEIATMAVRLANVGTSRVIELQQVSGNGDGIALAGADGLLNRANDPFPGSGLPASSLSAFTPRLQPLSIPMGGDPIAKMRALRQQLIKH